MSGVSGGAPPREAPADVDLTSCGINPNFAAAMAYFLWGLSGFALLLVERRSTFVRFHAAQSMIASIPLVILWLLLSWIPYIGTLIEIAIGALWVAAMYRAYRGEMFKWPFVGEIAEENTSRP